MWSLFALQTLYSFRGRFNTEMQGQFIVLHSFIGDVCMICLLKFPVGSFRTHSCRVYKLTINLSRLLIRKPSSFCLDK